MNVTKSTRYKAKISEINFKEIISDSVRNLQGIENAHKMHIDTTIEGYIPFYNDRQQLQIIFNNLISNAIKFQHAHEVNPNLNIHIESDGVRAIITFSDNGMGIPKASISKVFDMFYRSPGTNADGSGLGLFMVKEVTKKLKGKIKVVSVEHEGSTFTLELPNRIDPDLLRQLNKLIQK